MSAHLERARLLLAQSRYDLAEKELRRQLGEQPGDPEAHALLALCLVNDKRYAEATEEAKAAVALGPDIGYTYYVLADVFYRRNHYPEAEQTVAAAIELDPGDADFRALLAAIRFEQRSWAGALAAAEAGLQLDPEHISCNNLRAMALVKLGRRNEAGITLEGALARDPDNAATHANQGWTLLEKGDTLKALEHFREALRLDPTSEWARLGVLEALKARYPLYRLILMYFLWMSKLSSGAQMAIVFGGWFGYQFLRGFAERNPDLAPFVWPLMAAYMIFCVLTWTASPLFNLLLHLNRFGRMVLSEEEKCVSLFVGICLLAALACLGFWAVVGMSLWVGALIFALLMIPVAGSFNCPAGRPRWIALGCLLVLIALGPGGLGLCLYGYAMKKLEFINMGGELIGYYFWGILGFSFLVNFLGMREPRL